MDILSPLVADRQPPDAPQPSQRARGHPAVAPQLGFALDAVPGDPRLTAPLAQGLAAVGISIPLVCVDLRWATFLRHPTAAWAAQQLREAATFGQRPRYLICDNDGKYAATFASVAAGERRVRALPG